MRTRVLIVLALARGAAPLPTPPSALQHVICPKCAHNGATHSVTSSSSSSWADSDNAGVAERNATLARYVCSSCTLFLEVLPHDITTHLLQGHWSMDCGKCGEWPEGSHFFSCKACSEHPLPQEPCGVWNSWLCLTSNRG